MGSEWKYIDFENNTIEVCQSSQYLPDKGIFKKQPKTETSKRIISVPSTVMNLLKQYRISQIQDKLSCGELWIENDTVFTQWNSNPMNPQTPSKWLPKFLVKHGLTRITFHKLRHTSAIILINAGVNVQAVSSRLGHSNTSTILNIYSHALKSAEKLEDTIF